MIFVAYYSCEGMHNALPSYAPRCVEEEFYEVRLEGLSTKVLGGSWPTGFFDGLGFPASGLPARAQQVLKRLSLYDFVRHTPGTEACHHRAVRSPKRGCVRVAG